MAMRKVLGSILSVCFIFITTGLLLEVAYRVYLGRIVAAEVDKRARAAATAEEQSFQKSGPPRRGSSTRS